MIQTTVCGIPCQVDVTQFSHQPALGPSADSDWDCYGYTEIEFDVYDRRGCHAPWLERKITDAERSRIETLIAGTPCH